MIHILCCIDNNYCMPLGVLIKSIILKNTTPITFHIMANNVQSSNKNLLSSLTDHITSHIIFYDINEDLLKSMPIRETGYLSIATYMRIFAQKILPDNLNKILYLDCDILVNKSLDELWNIDIDDFSIASVLDGITFNEDVYKRLNYNKNEGYFNAGVLLINLKKWRKINLLKQALDYIQSNRQQIINEDQDVLNALLHKDKKLIPLKFNATYNVFEKQSLFLKDYNEEVEEAIYKPIIIHFTYIKPWNKECNHPYQYLFEEILKTTPWKNNKKTYFFKGKKKIIYIVKQWLIRLHIITLKKSYLRQL